MWVLGQKTEDFATKLNVINGGFLELLGGTYRMNWDQADFNVAGLDINNRPPLFIIDNANASFAGFTSWGPNIPFDPVIREKRISVIRNQARGTGNGEQALYVGYTQGTVSVNEQVSSSLKIYPNPASGSVFIILPSSAETADIRLMDLTGKVVLEKNEVSGSLNMDLQNVSKGIYFLSFQYGGQSFHHKIIVN
jgi:hypothetical protein